MKYCKDDYMQLGIEIEDNMRAENGRKAYTDIVGCIIHFSFSVTNKLTD